MKPKFNHLSKELAAHLTDCGIQEEDLFNHETDLHVGVNDWLTVKRIRQFNDHATTFHPQKGSDMDNYKIGVEIPFALIDYKIMKKSPPCTNFKTPKS